MAAYLGFSITSSGPTDDVAAQERRLLAIAAACPEEIVFYDVLRDGDEVTPVRILGGLSPKVERIASSEAPPHVGELFGSFARDLLGHFEDLGDVLLPGLDGDQLGDLDLGAGEPRRVLGSLEELADALDEELADDEFVEETEPETLELLEMLRQKVAIARRHRLPLVASW